MKKQTIAQRLAACERAIGEYVNYTEHALPLGKRSWLQLQIRDLRRQLSPEIVQELPGGDERPRIYCVAAEHVAKTAGMLDTEALQGFASVLGQNTTLLLRELCFYPDMLRLALLERLSSHLDCETEMRACLESLQRLDHVNWRDFVESVYVVEQVLRRDPAGAYAQMDFSTRERYRRQVEKLAQRSGLTEEYVAERAVARARETLDRSGADSAEAHVGYYLIGAGVEDFAWSLGCQSTIRTVFARFLERRPGVLYAASLGLAMGLVVAGFYLTAGPFPAWVLALLLIPASQAAIEVANSLISHFLAPSSLPSMDFHGGLPDSCRTLVAVPCLLLSPANVQKLVADLEIRYLANRDPNLLFGLVTDFPDADQKNAEADGILTFCVEGIRRLNVSYGDEGHGPFYLFHRARQWNRQEGKWMGYERKRGKLNDLNKLLLEGVNRFDVILGERPPLRQIRYVISLDADTQLPRDTAVKLVGAIAHPLNRPIVNPLTRSVEEGYGIIQPRVPVSMESASRSLFSRVFSGLAGFDPYSTTAWDLYQDLFGRASFIGKGIYDVAAFDAAVGARFPENTILSHDLIEGEHVRTGFLPSAELVEDCPATYRAYCQRKHRWVRGDWQLLPWLFSKPPGADGATGSNPLSWLSRWKILDNLRRSLVELAVLLLLVTGWILFDHPLRWTLVTIGLLLAPAYVALLFSLTRAPCERRMWPAFARDLSARFVQRHRDALLTLAFLPHQACLMADAIARTLVRRFITGRRLLEWQTMAQAEAAVRRSGMVAIYFYLSTLSVLAFLLNSAYVSPAVSLVCTLWIFAPLIAVWLSGPIRHGATLSRSDQIFLLDTALRTWRFFADHRDSEHHWLIPDNVQQDPPMAAHRISPTNLGMSLTAELAAHELGYQTVTELSASLDRVFGSMGEMPRYQGHFFNWYDTLSLQPAPPAYVSTVDSGNLAASLCTLRQGLQVLQQRPMFGQQTLAGLRDHALRLRDQLWPGLRSHSLMRAFASLLRVLDCEPTDLFFWEGVLTDANELVVRIREAINYAHARRDCGEDSSWQELMYWDGLLGERIRSALAELYSLAPWLAPAFEPELRVNALSPTLSDLMAELSLVPILGRVEEQYERICARITERLGRSDPLYPALRSVLCQLMERLPEARTCAARLVQTLDCVSNEAFRYFEKMEFSFLYHKSRGLLRIGYDAVSGRVDEACYDLLASEARTAVFLAVAKGDIPRETWFKLGRKLTACSNQCTLLSWSGTMFEYLMPLLHLRTHGDSLLDRSLRAAVRIQRNHAQDRDVPWGISEAAFADRDSLGQYQYRAFGVPALKASPERSDRLVVAPYASMLALMLDPAEAAANLRALAHSGCVARYGFFESIDYSGAGGSPEIIRCFMTHHQGMGLLAIVNTLLHDRMQELFHREPLVQATEFLLEERMPDVPEVVPALVETAVA